MICLVEITSVSSDASGSSSSLLQCIQQFIEDDPFHLPPKEGLSKKFKQAKPFYLVIGLFINFIDIDPIEALVYTAVINGIAAVPILYAILKICNDKTILENGTNGRISNIIGWSTFLIMGVSVVILFLTQSISQ
jgi:Mn2+/Fe2+ NRAMP family transporter